MTAPCKVEPAQGKERDCRRRLGFRRKQGLPKEEKSGTFSLNTPCSLPVTLLETKTNHGLNRNKETGFWKITAITTLETTETAQPPRSGHAAHGQPSTGGSSGSGPAQHQAGLRYERIQRVGRPQAEVALASQPAPGTAVGFPLEGRKRGWNEKRE